MVEIGKDSIEFKVPDMEEGKKQDGGNGKSHKENIRQQHFYPLIYKETDM